MIRFMAGHWRLLELDQRASSASLTAAWTAVFGGMPDFGEEGDAVTGFHAAGEIQGERHMRVARAASKEAVRHSIRLLTTRYSLDGVRLVGELDTDDASEDWMPDLDERPYDLSAVSVWPPEQEHLVRDEIVLELTNRPGHYIHRLRRDRRALWTVPADRVADALCLPLPEAGHAWIATRACAEDGPLLMKWRSVALAAEDQARARETAAI